ncbi:lytic transglycosylase [Roseibacterium sp. SDUM158017]|uniref:transglycosylase SLT domain-containing protein n=1 Tax=Roseicyclus salinarum TaxID=3036773 RepID=UPI002415875C|nr:lytic transglycosylase [Roseibacterium sp. SDUM158017]MDG4650294.1 lytic transglycosylase [Roseibacterium sp. SDUM158017]
MKSIILLVIAAGVLAACGGGNYSAPRNLDNACLLADERPQYFRAMERAERRWGVPVAIQMATFHQESRFVGNARPPHRYTLGIIPMGRASSAYGYSQALDGTWQEYQAETGNRRARRTDIADAADFMGWYMTLSRERNGIALTDARNQYLAYHEGHAGYRRGSYNAKSWLLRVADDVATRAQTYELQLITCGRR